MQMWSNATWIVMAASVVLAAVALSPPQPQSRRAAKLAAWTMATMAAHWFGLELWVAAFAAALTVADMIHGVAKHRAGTLIQLQLSVPTPVLHDARYRIGIELYAKKTALLQAQATEARRERQRSGAERQAVRQTFGAITVRPSMTTLPFDARPADEPSFVGVPSVWRLLYDCAAESVRTKLGRPRLARYLGVLGQAESDQCRGVLGQAESDQCRGAWCKLRVAGFGKARHVVEDALLLYPILWHDTEPYDAAKSSARAVPLAVEQTLSFRVESSQIVRRRGFVYLRARTRPPMSDAHVRQVERHAEQLHSCESAMADRLDRGAPADFRGTVSVFALSAFFVTHCASAPTSTSISHSAFTVGLPHSPPSSSSPSPPTNRSRRKVEPRVSTQVGTTVAQATSCPQSAPSATHVSSPCVSDPHLPLQQPLPPSLRQNLVNGERYFWMQTLAAHNDNTPTEWTTPRAHTVTLHGIAYWSTAAAARSIRAFYSFTPI